MTASAAMIGSMQSVATRPRRPPILSETQPKKDGGRNAAELDGGLHEPAAGERNMFYFAVIGGTPIDHNVARDVGEEIGKASSQT